MVSSHPTVTIFRRVLRQRNLRTLGGSLMYWIGSVNNALPRVPVAVIGFLFKRMALYKQCGCQCLLWSLKAGVDCSRQMGYPCRRSIRLCLKTRSGFESRRAGIVARRKTGRSRADDGVFGKSPVACSKKSRPNGVRTCSRYSAHDRNFGFLRG